MSQSPPRSAFERWATRLHRVAMHFFPPAFRENHAADMEAWFLRGLRRRSGAARLVWVGRALVNSALCGGRDRLGGARALRAVTFVTGVTKHAARGLSRKPVWTLLVLTALALPAAANTAILAVVNAAVLAPLPYANADRLTVLWAVLPDVDRSRLSGPELHGIASRSERFESSGGVWSRFATMGTDNGPVHVDVGWVTGGFFETLVPQVALGRALTREDDREGVEPTVLLTHGVWRASFGADSSIVGRVVDINGVRRQVVGVLAPDFRLLLPNEALLPDGIDVYAPWGGGYAEMDPDWHLFASVARIAPGIPLATASEELTRIAGAVAVDAPSAAGDDLRLVARPLRAEFTSGARAGLGLLVAGALGLWFVAASNVSGLLVARMLRRRGELAVMRALGASRRRVAAVVMAEGLIVFALAGAVGSILALAALRGFQAIRPSGLRYITEPSLSAPILLSTLAGLAAVAVVASLIPALRVPGDLRPGLTQAGRGGTGPGTTLRSGLVVAQVAVSLVLLVGCGLMVRSMAGLSGVDHGFQSAGISTFRVTISGPEFPYENPEAISGFYEELRSRLESDPSTTQVGLTEQLPLSGSVTDVVPYSAETPAGPIPWGERTAQVRPVSVGYLETLSTTIIEGRLFQPSDNLDSTPVAVIDQGLAERLWPGQSALGRRVLVDVFVRGADERQWVEVVGVVKRVKLTALSSGDPPQIWLHHVQSPRRTLSVAARVAGPPERFVAAAREILSEIAPTRALFAVRPLNDFVTDSTATTRFLMLLTAVFSILSIALAALGLFGVLAHVVADREREISIRLALGASPPSVAGGLVRSGLRLVALGAVIGVVAAWWSSGTLASLVFGIPARDPVTFGVSVALAILVGLAACCTPALRALRISPAQALR